MVSSAKSDRDTTESYNAHSETPQSTEPTDLSSRRSVQEPGNANRKIIYSASLALVVDDFESIDQRIRNLVKEFDGYVANSDLDRMQGRRRMGRWTARIPADAFDRFLDEAQQLGIPESFDQDARDVTEEYVDTQARIANKKKLEARILELLERPDDKIQHVIEVERELGRVREEIERMEGRIRFLNDRISMTTVSISIREEREYTPPQAPTFDNRISAAWSTATRNLKTTTQDTLVYLVANAFGFLFLLLLAIGLLFGIRRFLKRRGDPSSSPQTA